MLGYKNNCVSKTAMLLLAMAFTLGLTSLAFGQATSFESYGFRASFAPLKTGWVKGNLGDSWHEGEWVPYQLVISNVQTDYPNLSNFPEIKMSYDFTSHGFRFVDLVRGIQFGTVMLTDAQGWPDDFGAGLPMGTEAEVEAAQNDIGNTGPLANEWADFTLLSLPEDQINRDLAGGIGTPTDAEHTFRISVDDLTAAGLDPTTETIVIYYQLHESRSFIWDNTLQKYYSDDYYPGAQTDGWGGYLYALDTPPYSTDSREGSGHVPGSSGHIEVEFGSGAKTVPIPIPERLPGTASGLKWRDDNGNGVMDGAEPTLSGWRMTVFGMVEGIVFSAETLTDEFGDYSFPFLTVGTWTIKEAEQRDVPAETGYWQTYPQIGTEFGQGDGVAVGPPPPDAAGVGWEVELTLAIPDQGSMDFGNLLCEMQCEITPPEARICEGDCQEFCVQPIDGTAPFTYLWNTGEVTQCITKCPPPGTYTYWVKVTDANNCTTSCETSLIVDENPSCTIDPPSALICEGACQDFCVQPTGGTPPYTYLWNTGEVTQCITKCPPAGFYTYWVKVTDARGCTTSCATSLDVVENPTCAIDPPSARICEGDCQEFCVIPNGTPPFTYLWNTGEVTQCITKCPPPGTYSYWVKVTDANDCTTSCETSLIVDENPSCTIDPPSARICEGDCQEFCVQPTGGTPPYTYLWSSGEVTQCITKCPPPGTYTYSVKVTDARNCTTSCATSLTVDENPSCTIDPPSALICQGDCQEFCVQPTGGTPPYTYLWNTGEVTQCITKCPPTGTYHYWVKVTDAQNCTTSCDATLEVEPCDFCTYTMGGWGSECPEPQQGDPMSTQPGCIRDHYFSRVFPTGVVIGDPAGPGSGTNWYAALWTSASAVEAFLPAGSTPGALTADLTDPVTTPAGVLAGQILALRMNVEYSCAGVFADLGLPGVGCYGGYIISDVCGKGKFDGMSVNTFLAIADSAVGGLDVLRNYRANFSHLNKTATCLNELHNNCNPYLPGPGMTSGSAAKSALLPKEFSLSQSYPNPFNPSCVIAYALPTDCHVTLNVYNMLGQKVKVLVDEHQSAGHKSATWDGKDADGRELSTGIYFYRIMAGDFVQSKKMVLIK